MLIPHSHRKRLAPPVATVIGTVVAIAIGVGVSAVRHGDRGIVIAVGIAIGLVALAFVVIAFIRKQNIQH